MQSRDSLSNERPPSGVELAVATVAQWPDADGHNTAIYRPVLGKRFAHLTRIKFQELKDRQFLR